MAESQNFTASNFGVGIRELGSMPPTGLDQWRQLKDQWLHSHGKADFEQKIMDEAFETFLEGKGPRVSLAMQEFLDGLWLLEAEARAKMDEFIAENFG